RLGAERVLVVQVRRAQLRERSAIAPGDRGAQGHQELVRAAQNSGRPVSGVEASAYRRRGMRPARRASQPASTPARIAVAIATGSSARLIALAHSTASQPSSIASAASDAVPTPASRMTGSAVWSRSRPRLYGL